MKKTFDVVFSDDSSYNCKHINGTLKECMDWILHNYRDTSTYFGDYTDGTVSVVCVQTGITYFQESISNLLAA